MILTPWVSYKKQELPSLRDQMSSLPSFWWDVCCLSFFIFLWCVFRLFFVCLFLFVCLFVYFIYFYLRFVSCTQCFLSVCIAHSLFSFVFFCIYLGICVCLLPHFSDISPISYVGDQYYLLRKP